MSHLTKPVHNSQNGGVALRGRKAGKKVQGDVGPRMMKHRERLQETSRCLVGCPLLAAHRTGIDKLPCVTVKRRPPGPLFKKLLGGGALQHAWQTRCVWVRLCFDKSRFS